MIYVLIVSEPRRSWWRVAISAVMVRTGLLNMSLQGWSFLPAQVKYLRKCLPTFSQQSPLIINHSIYSKRNLVDMLALWCIFRWFKVYESTMRSTWLMQVLSFAGYIHYVISNRMLTAMHVFLNVICIYIYIYIYIYICAYAPWCAARRRRPCQDLFQVYVFPYIYIYIYVYIKQTCN
jgi:hypothetical protein